MNKHFNFETTNLNQFQNNTSRLQLRNHDINRNRNTNKLIWSWIIAFSCCWINIFLFGVFRSAGVLYRAFVNTYNCTYQEASWPISLAGSVASITGIAAGFLTHYFNIRTLVFFGILITSIAISACYFADTIIFIIVSLGIIQGNLLLAFNIFKILPSHDLTIS